MGILKQLEDGQVAIMGLTLCEEDASSHVNNITHTKQSQQTQQLLLTLAAVIQSMPESLQATLGPDFSLIPSWYGCKAIYMSTYPLKTKGMEGAAVMLVSTSIYLPKPSDSPVMRMEKHSHILKQTWLPDYT